MLRLLLTAAALLCSAHAPAQVVGSSGFSIRYVPAIGPFEDEPFRIDVVGDGCLPLPEQPVVRRYGSRIDVRIPRAATCADPPPDHTVLARSWRLPALAPAITNRIRLWGCPDPASPSIEGCVEHARLELPVQAWESTELFRVEPTSPRADTPFRLHARLHHCTAEELSMDVDGSLVRFVGDHQVFCGEDALQVADHSWTMPGLPTGHYTFRFVLCSSHGCQPVQQQGVTVGMPDPRMVPLLSPLSALGGIVMVAISGLLLLRVRRRRNARSA